jgi:hypothetical protein
VVWSEALVERKQAFLVEREKRGKKEMRGYWGVVIL